jgi:hypothetical protein
MSILSIVVEDIAITKEEGLKSEIKGYQHLSLPNISATKEKETKNNSNSNSNNIHAYTTDLAHCLAELVKQGRHHAPWYKVSIAESEMRYALEVAQQKFSDCKLALQNIAGHYSATSGGIFDPELPAGMNVAYWFVRLMEQMEVKSIDQSLVQLVQQTLQEIGSTCIQGVSHRLWSAYDAVFALRRLDETEEKKEKMALNTKN